MGRINRAGQAGSLGDLDIPQSGFRDQANVLADIIRQLGGNPEVQGGAGVVNDPLNSMFVLYVNPQIGRDTFVAGDYSSADDGTDEQRFRRISLQRLECGYTPARPFRTINRAIVEAAILTSRTWLNPTPAANTELVSIVLAPGVHIVLNGLGTDTVTDWTDGAIPTDDQLRQYNDTTRGGIILPRGCSLIGSDLRKTVIRPSFVPIPAAEAPDHSNRRTIFRTTGGGYYFGFTFMDQESATTSHHLLDCFQFASQGQLDRFYGKVFSSLGAVAGLGSANTTPRETEYEIVGDQPADAAPVVDTVDSASPYIYNVSIRSTFGMCGIFADGSQAQGFRSMVVAQYTGVSLQRDMSCWQKYQGGSWVAVADYDDYISQSPNNVRMTPDRRSFHIRAINDAIIQEVSVFAIGQGVHHWTESGGELTVTNSNSNFGGCAALAEGYKSEAFTADQSWRVNRIRVATDMTEETRNVRQVKVGRVATGVANNATTIKLETPLEPGVYDSTIPRIMERDGYTFRQDSYIWVETARTSEFRAQFAAVSWDPATPDELVVQAAFVNQDGIHPGDDILDAGGSDTGTDYQDLAGSNLYIRRVQDVRTSNERRYALLGANTSTTFRNPLRDYVLQTNTASPEIDGLIPDDQLIGIGFSAAVTDVEGNNSLFELRRLNPASTWTAGNFYRPGDTVRNSNKHYTCNIENQDTVFDVVKWTESYVHMEEGYDAEDYFKNIQPKITFDNDTDGDESSLTLGYNFSTVWSTDALVRNQYRSSSDYKGVHSFLMSIGFSDNDAHTILLPKPEEQRDRNPAAALDGITNPAGAANAWANWAIEFRRPSNIRLFGHAYEWAGFANYSKSLPIYQRDMTAANRFTYYFTNQNAGRVYGSGFNEDGFLVTPQGIQDLTTGEQSGFDALGGAQPTDEIEFPTFYEALNINNLTVNTQLTLSGTITGGPNWEGGFGGVLPELPVASETVEGIVELASDVEADTGVADDLAITPAGLERRVTRSQTEVVNLIGDRLVPVGTVIHVAGSAAPAGWLIANGDTVPNGTGTVQGVTADFSALHTVLGSTYGAAGRLPDLRGQFIRSWNSGVNADGTASTIDDGRARGSNQGAGTAAPANPFTGSTNSAGRHNHTYNEGAENNANRDPGAAVTNQGRGPRQTTDGGEHTHSISLTGGGDPETRPVNISLLGVIKF